MSKNVRRHVLICAAAAVTALGILGCNGEDDAAPVAQPAAPQQEGAGAPPARQTTPPQTPADEPRDAAAPTADNEPARQTETAPPPPTDTAPPTPQSEPPAAQSQPPAARAQQQPPAPSGAAAAAANTPQAKARALLDQLLVQKGQAKWAEGEKTLQELEKLKGSVPKDMRDEIEAERSSFRAAKSIWGQDR